MAEAAPDFDPTQPFEPVASSAAAPPFDQSKPFEAAPSAPAETSAAPAFDPSKPFESATDEAQWRGYLPVAASAAARGAVSGVGTAIAGAPELVGDYNRKLLATLNKIDSGEKVPMAEDPIGYQDMDAETRKQTKADIERAAASYKPQETSLYKAGKGIEEYAKQKFPLSPVEEQSLTAQAAGVVGGMVPYLAAGAVLGPGSTIALGAGQMGLSSAHEQAEAARAKGATPEQAAEAARLGAYSGAAMGVVPLHAILSPVERLSPGIADWARARLIHAAQSGVAFATIGEAQTWLGQEIANNFYDPEAGYSFDVKRVLSGLLGGAFLGALGPTPYRGAQQPAVVAPEAHADAIKNILGEQPPPPQPPTAPQTQSILPENATVRQAVEAAAINLRGTLGPRDDYTPGLKAQGQDAADALKVQWAVTSPIKTIDHLFENAQENQDSLASFGSSIADELGIDFKNPGVKGRPRTQEKIDDGKMPARINDVVRAGFVVDRPDQAETVVQRLAQQFPIIDEGWAVTPVGYFDRKIIVRFPNGQAGEVQLWHPDLLDAKDARGGHKLYLQARTLPAGDPRKAELENRMREIYSQALAAADPEWKAVVGSGGVPGNLALNAALESTRPSIAISDELAGAQAPLASTQASPGAYTKGAPSTVPNVNVIGRTITNNIGQPIEVGKPVPNIPPHRVTTADGMSVDVMPVVVEAGSLLTSQDSGYNPALQPRQRSRAASQAQVRDIATNLDPERLGYSAEADRGAPIVGPDGMVESGNGRILALRSVYGQNGEAANAYRNWLTRQGINLSGFQNPVLVRQRITPMADDQRQAFTVSANQAATLSMSAPERAFSDARLIDNNVLGLLRNADDLGSLANRAFVRRFVERLPQGEQGMMADAKGGLSAEGLMRVRNAILAKAYGDTGVLSRIAESTNDEVKSISSALTASAPEWAKMRAGVEAGAIRPDIDATGDLLEAVARTADIRSKNERLDAYLAQQDAFDRLPAAVEGFMRMFYDPKGQRAASSKRITDALRFYAQEAAKVNAEEGLGLGLVPIEPRDIIQAERGRYEQEISDRAGVGYGPSGEAVSGEARGSWLGEGREVAAQRGPFGDEESRVRAQQLSFEDLARGAEPIELAGGKKGTQYVIPGTERITAGELARRRAKEALKPKATQLPMEEGLFGTTAAQQGLNLPPVQPNIMGTELQNAAPRPAGPGIRPGTQAVPRGQQPERLGRPTPIGKPEQLSLFGGAAGERSVFDANDAVQKQQGNIKPAIPGPSDSVTKPPTRSGRISKERSDIPAVAGIDEAESKIAQRASSNYRITDADQIGVGGPKQKVRANLDAIRILRQIEDEARDATPAEKAQLVKYVGWGAFAQDMFSPHKTEWKKERDEFRALVSDEEYNAAKGSTLNAHFTSPDVVRGIWDSINHLGFKGGMALEPAAGVGHFIGMIPDKMAPKTAWTAVELDQLTGRIAKALYGKAEVNVHGFEDLKRPSNYYDLAVSNVPFGNYNLSEKPYGAFPIHDFFFVKSLDKVRPGGVVAFITSRYSMDRVDSATRRLLAKNADLVGAIRLPGGNKGAFAGNAGTAVTTDIIYLRKKIPGEAPFPGANWMDLKEIHTPEGPVKVNEYFADRPEMMLGEMRLQGTMYRDNEPVLIGDSEGLQDKILAAARNMPKDTFTTRASPPPPPIHANEIGEGIKDGAFFVKDGEIYQRRQGQGFAHPLAADDHDRVTRLVGMRDMVNDLLDKQIKAVEGQSAAESGAALARQKLQRAYDAFVEAHGPINKEVRTVTNRVNKAGEPVVITRYPNIAKFMADPDAWKVAAIEKYDPETDKATRADIQTKDVINPPRQREINGPTDALAASLNDTGSVDLDHIAQSLNLDNQEAVVRSLGDLIYQNPDGRKWETSDGYLSGNVVKKLEDAREIAKEDPSYLRNVSALEKVQPTPLTASDITAQFGAPWVPPDVYASFLKEIGGSDVKVAQVPITGEWRAKASFYSRDARSKYGTDRVEVNKVVDAALNNRQLTVWDEDSEGNKHVNDKATTEARVKVEALKEAFTGDQDHGIDGWAFADPDRARQLEAIYNRTYNNLRSRNFDGSHLTMPGLNPDFATRKHRLDAVWRIIQNGNTLLAHVVGSGKTVTMIAAGMEQKRLGLISKPAYVVPNHMLEQFSREFIQAYPNAKILVASKEETTRENRKEFLAKVAANDWDGVIITHDAFGRIGMGLDYRKGFIQDQLDELERVMRAEKEEGGKSSPTVKALEKSKKRLQGKLDALLNEERKDTGTSFEESGIDHLFVDEAHKFKNLAFITRLQRIKGLAQGDSQRAEDLFLKIRYLEQKRPGRSAVFATGTPVSNTMAELWTMMRYLEYDRLKERGLDTFDNWASTFGRVVTNSELSADGRTFKDVASFSKFVNVPELISIYSEIADTKTADMLNLPRPEVKTRRGAPGIEIVEATPSSQEEAFIQSLVDVAGKLKGKQEPGKPNMASISTAGRKVALDGRLVGNTLTDRHILSSNEALKGRFDFNPQGKIALAVNNIHDIWQKGQEPGMVQMVFLDMGMPKTRAAARPKKAEAEGEEGVDPAQAEMPRIDLYADLKQRLIDKGIPAKEIAAIHDATDDNKKAKLFSRVRSGDVRVLLGSSEKMGVGTNVQDRLIAMHHLDAPWKPAEVEQRDGRIVRQGNKNPEVQIFRYVTKKSFDAFMWQKLDTKSKFIGQVLSGAKGSRHAEDIDNPLPEAAEMKAAASGDPRIIEHAELDRQVRALTAQRRSFESTKSRATWEVGNAQERIKRYEEAIPGAKEDADRVEDVSGENFKADLGGTVVTDRKAAGQAILDRLNAVDPRTFYTPKVVNVGKLSGFDMNVQLKTEWDGTSTVLRANLSLKGKSGYASPNDTVINPQTDPGGLIRRFENLLGNIKQNPDRLNKELAGERDNVKRLQKTLGETWPREKDYREAIAKLDNLTKELKGPKHPDVAEAEVEARRPGFGVAEGRELGPKAGEKAIQIGRKAEAYIKPSERYTAAEQKIADAVTEIGNRMAPQAQVAGAAALRMEGRPIWGAFVNSEAFPHLIAWSLEQKGAERIAGTVRHEIIHHLKESGLIRKDEWAALRNAAIKDGWLNKYNIHERYLGENLDQKIEEAVAEHFSKWNTNRSIEKPGLIRDAFQRLGLFLRRVADGARRFLGKDATANDVFTRIETGEVGKRPSEQIEGQKRYFAEKEAAQTPGEEARKRRETANITPTTIRQRIVAAGDMLRNKAAQYSHSIGADELVREMQMRVSPMAARDATVESRYVAKEYMNARRQSRQVWNDADRYIMDNFDHETRRNMWDAANEQSELMQQGKPTAGVGLDRLPPEQRQVVEMLQQRAARNFQDANDLKMVDSPGLPSYAPRMFVRMAEGSYERGAGPKAEVVRDIRTLALANAKLEDAIAARRLINSIAEIGKRSGNETVNDGGAPTRASGPEGAISHMLDQFGRGLSTTTPQLRHRKYLTREESEAAASKVPVGSENAPRWFTLSHPAFQKFEPRWTRDEETGKVVPVKDAEGNIIFDRKPIYVRHEFEGPLRAVLSRDTDRFYRGLMALKGKVMSVIMMSPLIHNQVEWGRALPAAPGKVVTFQTYFEGNRIANDPAQMRRAISGGVVPIGGHGFMQDIVSMAEAPTIRPGGSLTAKGLGYGTEALGHMTRLFNPRSGADEVRRAVDWFGTFWHNTLLWDRVRDLQMGLWGHFEKHLIDKGYDPYAANVAAAHFANRYAGALPLEAMSGLARGIANVMLFSRTFTLGNIGAYKDAVIGLPRDAQALIQHTVGWDELQKIQSYVKRKSMTMLAIDAGLYYATLSALQSAFNVAGVGHTVATLGGMIAGGALGGKGGPYGRLAAAVGLGAAGFGLASVLGASQGTRDLEDELGRYWDRFKGLLSRVSEHPLEVLGNPFKAIESLGATAENEPGKQNRLLVGYDSDGTGIYARMAVGKVTEELIGYATEPNQMLHRKLSTFARVLDQLYNNDVGFGRKAYNPKADTPAEVGKNIAKIAGMIIGDQLPMNTVSGLHEWYKGGPGSGVSGAKAVSPIFGTTVSKGYPGGPELGVLAEAKARQQYRQQEALPGIRDQIRQGDSAGAIAKMQELNFPSWLQKYYLATTLNPSARMSKSKLREFMQSASPEEKHQLEIQQQRGLNP